MEVCSILKIETACMIKDDNESATILTYENRNCRYAQA